MSARMKTKQLARATRKAMRQTPIRTGVVVGLQMQKKAAALSPNAPKALRDKKPSRRAQLGQRPIWR